MVRTRGGPTKVSAGKAPGKSRTTVAVVSVGDSRSGSSGSKLNQSFGNSYHPRETPSWQKPINSFFQNGGRSKVDNNSLMTKLEEDKENVPGSSAQTMKDEAEATESINEKSDL
ncbi:uncharacterized protein LOC113378461 [Ctenocephalides felis]|uniref:uncharacterized protein LOC113378461 n=1 Tax=Ctenocephalides felis TaxID=7515 RepID=UPI000E6E219F|nr:uncharacterized protein LOC113378461 [Ctenocephalides felis]